MFFLAFSQLCFAVLLSAKYIFDESISNEKKWMNVVITVDSEFPQV